MDLVVNRLSKIEAAAVRILEEASIQKQDLDRLSKKTLQEFDAKIDAKTLQELDILRKELDAQITEKLDQLQTDTEENISNITSDYHAHHKQLANELFMKLIKE